MSIKNNFRKDVLIMEKHFKRTSAVLLIATSFILNLNSINAKADKDPLTKTYSYEVNNLGEKSESFCYEDKELDKGAFVDARRYNGTLFQNVVYEGLPFYLEYPKSSYTRREDLQAIFKDAKDRIYKVLGLNYNDKMKTKIFVKENLKYDYNHGTALGYFFPNNNKIYVNKYILPLGDTLAHEMTHALLCHSLGEHCNNFNIGINEGLATQNQDLGSKTTPFKHFIPSNDMCFSKSYPSDSEKMINFYGLHQYMVHDWIKSEGKDVVKKWIEKVKNGEDSVKSFLDLGGDKIAQKYNCNIEKNENLVFRLLTDVISSAKKFFSFK